MSGHLYGRRTNLVNVVGIRAVDLNGVRGDFSVKSQSSVKVLCDEFRSNPPLGEHPDIEVSLRKACV